MIDTDMDLHTVVTMHRLHTGICNHMDIGMKIKESLELTKEEKEINQSSLSILTM